MAKKKTIRSFKTPVTPPIQAVVQFVPEDISHIAQGSSFENTQYDHQIVECKKQGMSNVEVAAELGIGVGKVAYRAQALMRAEALKPAKQEENQLDLQVSLQYVADRLYWILQKARDDDSWKMQLDVYDRILKGIELASLIQEKVSIYKDQQDFYEKVMGVLESEIPGATNYIRLRMKEVFLGTISSPLIPEEPVDISKVTADNSLVATLGLGKEVVSRRAAGMTYQDIASDLKLTPAQVSAFCTKYSQMAQDRKKKVLGQSIFEVQARLKDAADDLFRLLDEIHKEENYKFELFAMDRIFRLIELAAETLERTEVLADRNRFQAATLSLLATQTDGVKARALKKLSDFQQGSSLLRPR